MGVTTEIVALVGATFTFVGALIKKGIDFYIEKKKLEQKDKEIEQENWKKKYIEMKKKNRNLKKIKINGQKNTEPDYDENTDSDN